MAETSTAMGNTSLPGDSWSNVTTSEDADLSLYLANIRDLALKVIYIIIGAVGMLDNVFVLVIFVLFIKITDKVSTILNFIALDAKHSAPC